MKRAADHFILNYGFHLVMALGIAFGLTLGVSGIIIGSDLLSILGGLFIALPLFALIFDWKYPKEL